MDVASSSCFSVAAHTALFRFRRPLRVDHDPLSPRHSTHKPWSSKTSYKGKASPTIRTSTGRFWHLFEHARDKQHCLKKLWHDSSFPAKVTWRSESTLMYEIRRWVTSEDNCIKRASKFWNFHSMHLVRNHGTEKGLSECHLSVSFPSHIEQKLQGRSVNEENPGPAFKKSERASILSQLVSWHSIVFKTKEEPWDHPNISSSCHVVAFKAFLMFHIALFFFAGGPAFAGDRLSLCMEEISCDKVSGNPESTAALKNAMIDNAESLARHKSDVRSRILSSTNGPSSMYGYGVASSAASKSMSIFSLAESASLCRETFGIFPCSLSLGGNLFLMLVYGYILLIAAKFISEGSELLLEVVNPGLIGGLLLPVLGALPDALLIFASGAGGTVQEAQQQVMIGVGVLAGSTTTILTVAWAGSLIAGRCDLSGPDGTAKDLTLTRGFDLFNTGVTTDEQTRWGAWIMILSTVPLICAQVPLIDGHPAEGPEAALAGSILAIFGLLAYCIYQVASPWLQQKQIEEARLQLLRSSALQGITSSNFNSMLPSTLPLKEEANGPSQGLLREIFSWFDKNKDGKIEEDELRGLIVGLNLDEEGYIPAKEQVETWLNEFDSDTDGMLTEKEFLSGISNWAYQVATERRSSKVQRLTKSAGRDDPDFWAAKLEEAKKVLQLLESETNENENVEGENTGTAVLNSAEIYKKAVIYLASGAALAAIFADPLVDSIQGFSTASSIPPFFVAFVVVPFASNASELFSSVLFAMRQRKRNISLTFSQIYGSVTMNNTLCLAIFLGLVYTRGLTWDFSSEVTVILFNILCLGTIGMSRTTFPLWYSIPVLALYFVSLVGVALLDSVLGWH